VDSSDTRFAGGRGAERGRRHPEARDDRAEGVLLPALVNAHCHLELSALAGAVPGGDGLVSWATQLMRQARALDRARAPAAATSAAADMVACGTAAIGDVGN